MKTKHATLLARQPIYNVNREVQAYELLFRGGDNEQANIRLEDGDQATSTLMSNLLGGIEVDDLLGEAPAYINFTRNLLLQRIPLDPDRYIIEVLEDVTVDAKLVAALTHYKQQNIKIALDDFVYRKEMDAILPLVDIVKVDVLTLSKEQVKATLEKLALYPVILLAEKVETYEMFEFCRESGFSLFQGYFLCKPENITGKKLDSSKLLVIRLLEKLQQEDVKIRDLIDLIDQDPNLAIRLIKLVNSPFYRRGQEIDSIKMAITIIGLDHLKRLVVVLALADMADKPSELVATALARANMLEALGKKSRMDSGSLFLLGILSLLDAFMDRLLTDIISHLSISADLKRAVVEYKGGMGELLKATVLFEQAYWQKLNWRELDKLHINPEAMRAAYIHGLKVARDITQEIT